MATFGIHGENWVQHVRDLWYDKDFDRSLQMFDETFGADCEAMTMDIKIDILEGRKTFTGLNNFDLVDETDWERPDDYPLFRNVLGMVGAALPIIEDKLEGERFIARDIIDEMQDHQDDRTQNDGWFNWSDQRMQLLANRWANLPEEAKMGYTIPIRLWQYLTYIKRATPQDQNRLDNSRLSDKDMPWVQLHFKAIPATYLSDRIAFDRYCFHLGVFGEEKDLFWSKRWEICHEKLREKYMAPTMKKKTKPKPSEFKGDEEFFERKRKESDFNLCGDFKYEEAKKGDPEFKLSDVGWINERGAYYPVHFNKHWTFADLFFDVPVYDGEVLAQKKGWIKVHYDDHGSFHITQGNKKVTQGQLNTLFDYCEKFNKKMPDWALEE